MGKFRYIFVDRKGKYTYKRMSPKQATEYGEKTKSVKSYGLASMFVFPHKKKGKRRKR